MVVRVGIDTPREGFRQGLLVVAQRWWVVAIAGLLGAQAGLLSSVLTPTVYEAQSALYVTAGADSSSASAAYQGSMASQQRVLSYGDLARSDSVLREALEKPSVSGVSFDELKNSVRASAQPNTVILVISVENESPVLAVELTNAVSASLVSKVSTLETSPINQQPMAKLTVVTPASQAIAVSPRKNRNIILGLFGGLIAGLIACLIAARFDSRVRSSDEIEELVSLPVLSEIPNSDSLRDNALVDFGVGGSPAPEAFRRLRTSITYSSVDRPIRSILVTSATPGEGKTTAALNLAAAFAELGKRVLLVEADLRRPSLSQKLSTADVPGFTDCLAGQAEVADLVYELSGSGVSVLSAGSRVANPSELLSSDKAVHLFESLVETYEVVVVDSPPVLPVSDSVVLSHLVDCVLVVAAEQLTNRADLVRCIDSLRVGNEGRVFIGGIVVNRSKGDVLRYGYYDGGEAAQFGRGVLHGVER